jgi:hypothetical protein
MNILPSLSDLSPDFSISMSPIQTIYRDRQLKIQEGFEKSATLMFLLVYELPGGRKLTLKKIDHLNLST